MSAANQRWWKMWAFCWRGRGQRARTLTGRGWPQRTFKWTECTEVHGTWWDAPPSTEGVGHFHCKAILNDLSKVVRIRSGFWELEGNKCHPYLQKGQEVQQTTGWSTSPHSPERWWSNSSWEPFPDTWWTRRWLRVASMDLWREKYCLTNLIAFCNQMTAWWMKGEQWILFIFTLARLLTLFPTTSS